MNRIVGVAEHLNALGVEMEGDVSAYTSTRVKDIVGMGGHVKCVQVLVAIFRSHWPHFVICQHHLCNLLSLLGPGEVFQVHMLEYLRVVYQDLVALVHNLSVLLSLV